jgi:hypothetical protein
MENRRTPINTEHKAFEHAEKRGPCWAFAIVGGKKIFSDSDYTGFRILRQG